MPSSQLTKVVGRTFTNAMEQLQEGYVSSIAATAGVAVQNVSRDLHKFDLEFVRQPDITQEEVSVKAQLKATTRFSVKPGDDHFKYRFQSREAFESLAMRRAVVKHILIVMLVNPDQRKWSYAHHRAMLTRQACYWTYLEGQVAPATPINPVIEIPFANIFNAASLSGILDRIEIGGAP